jgi:hypothetical protein
VVAVPCYREWQEMVYAILAIEGCAYTGCKIGRRATNCAVEDDENENSK